MTDSSTAQPRDPGKPKATGDSPRCAETGAFQPRGPPPAGTTAPSGAAPIPGKPQAPGEPRRTPHTPGRARSHRRAAARPGPSLPPQNGRGGPRSRQGVTEQPPRITGTEPSAGPSASSEGPAAPGTAPPGPGGRLRAASTERPRLGPGPAPPHPLRAGPARRPRPGWGPIGPGGGGTAAGCPARRTWNCSSFSVCSAVSSRSSGAAILLPPLTRRSVTRRK